MMPSLGSSWSQKRRRTGPNVESDDAPILENQHRVDNVVHSNCQGVDSAPVIIDLDTFDDDIAISSPRAFAEAKNNTRRLRGQNVVIDLDSEERSSCFAQDTSKKRMNREFMNNGHYSYSKSLEKKKAIHMVPTPLPPPPPPPPPKEPTLNCPVCMGPLVEEMSTKCGHIFCKICIKTAINTQKKCPTCRKTMTMRSVIRVYLPSITY